MKRWICILAIVFCGGVFMAVKDGNTEQKGKPAFGRTDPSKYSEVKNCHHGAGSLMYMELLEQSIFDTNLLFIQRGVILPRSSIGEHIHRHMEEMYIILDGRAQFTVNGRTAQLPAGSMVLCQMGSSHGIYNDTDKEVNYISVGVAEVKGKYDSIDYNDDLVNARVESPAPFLWANFDRRLLNPAEKAHLGKGKILFRRVWSKESFKTNWEFVDHCVLPPETSIGYHQHNKIEEVYYLVSGSGRMTVNDVTWDVSAGDEIPCTLHDSHGLYNDSDEDIELIVISVAVEKGARDTNNWGDDLTGR